MKHTGGKIFTAEDALLLQEIILHRRDTRGNRFLDNPLDDSQVEQILSAALHAPSVGFSQPWEFILIRDQSTRKKIKESFDEETRLARDAFDVNRQPEYDRLKLEGILDAPLNIAVFYRETSGPVLGQSSMKEAGLYSVVCAVQNMWLMARALNIGMGWVSILDPVKVGLILHAPDGHRLVAYLCLGHTDGFFTQPELEILQWEKRRLRSSMLHHERFPDPDHQEERTNTN